MESSTEVGKEGGPLAPWSVRFGCLRRAPRKTGQLEGAYRSSADDVVVVARDSGSRPAALETALGLRNRQKSGRGGCERWRCEDGLGRSRGRDDGGKKKSRQAGISAADPEQACRCMRVCVCVFFLLVLHPRDCSRGAWAGCDSIVRVRGCWGLGNGTMANGLASRESSWR
jgi:hypothetical protein